MLISITYCCCWWSFIILLVIVDTFHPNFCCCCCYRLKHYFAFASSAYAFVFDDDDCFWQCNSSGSFAWCNMLCLSLRALRYSFFHLVRATFLHLSMQRSCLLISGTFSSSISSSGSGRGFPYRNVFGDNTSIRIPSSTYIKGWLLSVTFLSKTISSNLFKFLQISSSSSCGFVQTDLEALLSARILHPTMELYLN